MNRHAVEKDGAKEHYTKVGNCNQAISLKTPRMRSMSAMAILQQLSQRTHSDECAGNDKGPVSST
jgi:hypothetical protein